MLEVRHRLSQEVLAKKRHVGLLGAGYILHQGLGGGYLQREREGEKLGSYSLEMSGLMSFLYVCYPSNKTKERKE